MKAIDFMRKHNIQFYWVFIDVYERKGVLKKRFINTKEDGYIYPDGVRSPTHFQTRPDLITKQMNYYLQQTCYIDSIAKENDWKVALMMDTNVVRQIDIDDPTLIDDMSYLEDRLPYYRSLTKRLPHFFFIPDQPYEFQNHSSTSYQYASFDILHGAGSLIAPDEAIFNYHKPFDFDFHDFISAYQLTKNTGTRSLSPSPASISLNQVEGDIPTSFYQHHPSYKLMTCLSQKRADDYTAWFDVACALKGTQFSYAFHIWKLFSKQSQKYEEDNFEEGGKDRELWDRLQPRRTIGSLHYWAKQDNPHQYAELFSNSYDTLKIQEETTLFKLRNPVFFVRLPDEIPSSKQKLQFLKRTDLRTQLENLFYYDPTETKEDKKYKCFVDRWFKDPNLRCYDYITFDPSPHPPPNAYNTFHGLEITRLQGGYYEEHRVTTIKEFLLQRLSGNDELFCNWLIKWLASIVQQPHKKTRVCPVIKSVEGIGKGLFCNFFGTKITGYYVACARPESLLEKFNGLLENKLFVNLNEISIQDTYNKRGTINELITDDTLPIERKGIDAIIIPNHLNFIATTNSNAPFPLTQTDRRYACVETNALPLTQPEIDFFTDFFQHPNTAYSFYHYLLTIELPSSLSHCRPITTFYKECKVMTSSPYINFWIYILNQESDKKRRFYTYDYLYEQYLLWRRRYYPSNDPADKYKSFCIKIKKFDYITIKRERTDKKDIRGLSVDVPMLLHDLKDYNEQYVDEDDEYIPYADEDELSAEEGEENDKKDVPSK